MRTKYYQFQPPALCSKHVGLAYGLFADVPATLLTTNSHFDVLFTQYDLAGDRVDSLDGWVRYTFELDRYEERQYTVLSWSFLTLWLGISHERRVALAQFAREHKNSTRWWYGSPQNLSNIRSNLTRQVFDADNNRWVSL